MSFEDFKKYHNANYHDGDSHFDERTYQKSNGDDFDCDFVQTCFDHFEAGAASRQVEINELQKNLKRSQEKIMKIQIAISNRLGNDDEIDSILNYFNNILKGQNND